MPRLEQTVGRIIPAYNGVLSQNLIWRQDRFDALARATDLRTTISIKEGNSREERAYETLGDTLAWKKIANPLDLLKIGIGRKRQVEVTPIDEQASADVFINHQLLVQEIMQASKGKFDERLFVRTFDTLARQGINNIIAREKLLMTMGSGTLLGISLVFLGLGAEAANLLFQGSVTNIFFRPPTEPISWNFKVIDSYLNYGAWRLLEGCAGLSFGTMDLRNPFRDDKSRF